MTQTELEALISKYQKAYYDGKELISDSEFDKLYKELAENYPDSSILNRVGEDTVTGVKINHWMTMGSQHKINSEEGLMSWLSRKAIEFPVIVSNKVDGNSFELQYLDRNVYHGITRGDGYKGECADRIALNVPSIPRVISESGKIAVRGEIVMNKSLFDSKYSKDFKNPRNLTAGLIKNEDFNNFSDLRFIAYDTSKSFPTQLDKLEWLSSQGFDTVEYIVAKDAKAIIDYRNERNPRDRDYAIDGLVLNQNNLMTSESIKDRERLRPDCAIAFKWKDESEQTVLREIEWSMSGNTLTPVAIFDAVELEGTTVKRASLANPSYLSGLMIGDVIEVKKHGQIIPHVECVVEHIGTEPIEIPKVCPKCGSPLIMRENMTKLYCDNSICPALLEGKLSKWFDVFEVKGFGPALIQHMVKYWHVANLCDLYLEDIASNVSDDVGKSASKAFKDLYEKTLSKPIPFYKVLAGLNIEGIGAEVAKTLNIEDNISFRNITRDYLLSIPGWSDIRADKLMRVKNESADEIDRLLDLGLFFDNYEERNITYGILDGFNICVTGKLNNFSRKDIEELIRNNGGSVCTSVKSDTNILITNTPDSGTSKNLNARKFGTKIITEDEFLEMING